MKSLEVTFGGMVVVAAIGCSRAPAQDNSTEQCLKSMRAIGRALSLYKLSYSHDEFGNEICEGFPAPFDQAHFPCKGPPENFAPCNFDFTMLRHPITSAQYFGFYKDKAIIYAHFAHNPRELKKYYGGTITGFAITLGGDVIVRSKESRLEECMSPLWWHDDFSKFENSLSYKQSSSNQLFQK